MLRRRPTRGVPFAMSADSPHAAEKAVAPAQGPVGVFDSGLGGLSVLREIRALLPAEDLIYVGNAAHLPYGAKTPEQIVGRSVILAEWLLSQGCKALVIACNTATAAAATPLRERWPAVPIVGMEPAVKPAVAATRNRIVGVLATVGTIRSARFAALLDRFGTGTELVIQSCPGLAEAVENGHLSTPETLALLDRFTAPLREAGADTVVLGCTHYPFLRDPIQALLGPHVTLIDTGPAVAKHLARRLTDAALLRSAQSPGKAHFFTTGSPAAATPVVQRLWSPETTVEKLER